MTTILTEAQVMELIERAHRVLQDKDLLSRKSAKTKAALAEVQFFLWRLDKAMRHLEYRIKQSAPTDPLVMVELDGP